LTAILTAPLASFLGGVFGRPGVVLHGETAVKKRQDLVKRFQEEEPMPFFVFSLKAGGSRTGERSTVQGHAAVAVAYFRNILNSSEANWRWGRYGSIYSEVQIGNFHRRKDVLGQGLVRQPRAL
jgi:hypothetical protein